MLFSITSKPLDVLHPLIPFNEGPSKDRRNSRSFPVTNAQLFLTINSWSKILHFRSCRIHIVSMQVFLLLYFLIFSYIHCEP